MLCKYMICKSIDMNVSRYKCNYYVNIIFIIVDFLQRKQSEGGHRGTRFCAIYTDLNVHIATLQITVLGHCTLEKGNKESQSV